MALGYRYTEVNLEVHITARWFVVVWLAVTVWAGAVSAAPSVPDPKEWRNPYKMGSRYWSVAEGVSYDKGYGPIVSTHLHGGYFVVNNIAVEYGAMVGYVEAERTEGGVLGGAQLGLRWHWLRRGRWSTFLDGFTSAVFQQHPISQDSIRFNFDVEAGGGGSYRLTETAMALAGFRWHHLSNAGIHGKKRNLGYDGPMLYLEFQHSF